MPHSLFRTERVAGNVYCRAKRFSFIKAAFQDYDMPGCHHWRDWSRNWKNYRKTQYKPCTKVEPEL